MSESELIYAKERCYINKLRRNSSEEIGRRLIGSFVDNAEFQLNSTKVFNEIIDTISLKHINRLIGTLVQLPKKVVVDLSRGRSATSITFRL